MFGGQVGIDHRQHEQGEDGADRQTGHDHDTDTEALGRTGTRGIQQRDQTRNHGGRGHQYGAQTHLGCLHHGFHPVHAMQQLLFLRHFADQNTVLGNQTH